MSLFQWPSSREFGLPMSAFEEEGDVASAPGLGEDDFLPIPGGAFIFVGAGESALVGCHGPGAVTALVGAAGREDRVTL